MTCVGMEHTSLSISGVTKWTLVLSDADVEAWDGERLEMLRDALWLVRQALAGKTEGPLTLPFSGVKIR